MDCAYGDCRHNKNFMCTRKKAPTITSSAFCPGYSQMRGRSTFNKRERRALADLEKELLRQEERDSWSADQFNGSYSYEPV